MAPHFKIAINYLSRLLIRHSGHTPRLLLLLLLSPKVCWQVPFYWGGKCNVTVREGDGKTDRMTDRQTDRQLDRQTDNDGENREMWCLIVPSSRYTTFMYISVVCSIIFESTSNVIRFQDFWCLSYAHIFTCTVQGIMSIKNSITQSIQMKRTAELFLPLFSFWFVFSSRTYSYIACKL